MVLTKEPAEIQMLLAKCMAKKLQQGNPYDEATFRQCYFETMPTGHSESLKVSELWSAALWAALQRVSASQLVNAAKNRKTLLKLVYGVWGKMF